MRLRISLRPARPGGEHGAAGAWRGTRCTAGSISGTIFGESPSRLRHRILIPAFEGSNPSSPARRRTGRPRACPTRFRLPIYQGTGESVMPRGSLMVFTGNANPKLAADVVRRLGI